MKRLLFAILLVVASTAVFGQVADRDVLLTSDGTLYTVDAEDVAATSWNSPASRYLTLTIQQGDTTTRTTVPESLTSGINWRPALAFDGDSRTLFVFWLHMPTDALASELYLASYNKGQWQRAVAIDSRPNDLLLRYNLKIAITRHVSKLQDDGTYADAPALLVHAAWWEESTNGEGAHYALVSIEKGSIASVETHALNDLVNPAAVTEVGDKFNREILRHPAFLDGPTSNSIDVVFGDTVTNSFNRVTLKPVLEGRLHIPIGHGGHQFPAPRAFSADWSGHVTTIAGHGDSDKLVFANTTSDSVNYIMFADGKWSTLKKLATSEKLSSDAAIAAVTKMVNSEQ
jgi:hypothetical protein